MKADDLRLGEFTIPRSTVRLLVRNLARFERALPLVLRLRDHMDEHRGGELPVWYHTLQARERDRVIAGMVDLEKIEKFIARFRENDFST